MKKIISYLITIMMVFTMIPYTAFAANEAPTNETLTVSYTKVNQAYEDVLSEADLNKDGEPFTTFSSEVTYASTPEEGAEVIREYMINRVDSFMLYYKYPASEVDEEGVWFQNLCNEMFPLAYQHTGDPVGGDYLHFTYGGYSIPETSISSDGTYYYLDLPVTMTYYTTYDQEEEMTAAVDTLLAEIITDDMTDYEKVKAIYDYMTANIVYDYDHYGDNSYKLQFTAYAALVNKTSVCQGYANLFYRLALECGIDSRIISGESTNSQGVTEGHAWNIVKLGEKYYLVDATWDASRAQADVDYDYFLQPSYSDHTNDAEYETDEFKAAYPMATEEYVPDDSGEQETPLDKYLYEVTDDNKLVITSYIGTEKDIVIPSTIDGREVYEIVANAFNNNDIVETITISEGIKRIGWYTFAECDSLAFVNLPSTIEYIGDFAFENCKSLEEIEIKGDNPYYVVYGNALYNNDLTELILCTNVETISIPETTAIIHDRAFTYGTNIKRVIIDKSNKFFMENEGVVYTADGTELVQIAGGVEEVTAIDSVVSIKQSAAFGNSALKCVVLGEGIKNIGEFAFRDCINLETVNIPDSVEIMGQGVFYECDKLETIRLSEKITSISDYLLFGCDVLKAVEISSNTETIGTASFCSCISLEEINLPNTLETIGENAFSACNSLVDVVIPEGVKSIRNYAFQACEGLRSIHIPSTVEIIGSSAIGETFLLETITVNENNNYYKAIDNVLYSKDGTILVRCSVDKEYFEIPNSVKKIDDSAFSECAKLKYLYIPENVEEIGDGCFNHNLYMLYVTVENKNTVFNEYIFNDCYYVALCGYADSTSQDYATTMGIPFIGIETHEHEVNIEESDSTCTEQSCLKEVCMICNDKKVTVISEALGHDLTSHTAKAPTCTEAGWAAYETCSRCDYTSYSEKAATGHTFQWVVDKEAAEDAAGIKHEECTVCAEKRNENTVIPKLDHVHDITKVAASAADCTNKGNIEHYICSKCGKYYADEVGQLQISETDVIVAALGHIEVEDAAVLPTCTETGLTAGKHCSVCNKVLLAQEKVDATGHTEITDAGKDATCTKAGITEGSHCGICNETLVAQIVIPATGHTEVIDVAVLPTCTKSGITAGSHCSVCNEILIAQEKVDALGHTEVIQPAVAETCTTDGLTEGKYCSVCEYVFATQEVIPATGHNFTWVVDTPATDTAVGSKHEECTNCGEKRSENTEISKLDCVHNMTRTEAVAATCTADGNIEYYTCTKCGSIYADEEGQLQITEDETKIISAGHKYKKDVTAATCTTDGYTTYTCSACDHSYVGDKVAAPGHNEVADEAVQVTCTTNGLTAGSHCSVCDKVLTAQEVVYATGHKYISNVVAPTCTTKGYTEHKCSVCGDAYTSNEKAATGHTAVTDEAKLPTCTEKGVTAGSHCSVCNEVIIAQKEVAALGHDLVSHAAQDATCTEEGWEAYKTCNRCDYTTFQQLGTTMHLFAEVVVPPTCTEDGYTKLVCSDCGMTIITNTTLATGHDIEAVVTPPTCTTAGYTTFTCNKCGKSYVADHLAATGHEWETDFTVDKAATMQAPGSKSKHCINCDATTEVTKIKRIKTAKVAAIAYNAKSRTPNPVIYDFGGKKLKRGTDYTVVYKNAKGTKVVKPKLVGKYTAKITFKGNYSGTIKRQFNINPKGPGPVKLSNNGKKQFTAKWTKRTAQVTGYEVKYGLKGKKAIKTVRVKNFKKNTVTIKGLKSKKNYWVQVRTYKTVNGTKYYSNWSVKKFIKTK